MISPEILGIVLTTAAEGNHFDWTILIKNAVNLLLLLLILGYFLKRPVKNFFVERRALIAGKIEDAREKIKAAREEFETYSSKLADIDKDIESLKESIRRESAIERNEILKQAEIAVERIGEEARETIRIESEKAKNEIREEVVALAVEMAEKAVKQNLTASDGKRFLEEFVQSTEGEQWHQ